MIEKIEDIRKAIENETYIVALALALTLPDICSQVENGVADGNRNMYINWIDKYMEVENYKFPIKGFEKQTFNGNMCYALRCKLLHNGNTEINYATNIDDFVLTKPGNPNYKYGYIYRQENLANGKERLITYIGIDYICESLCKTAETFYNNWSNKSDFNDHILDL